MQRDRLAHRYDELLERVPELEQEAAALPTAVHEEVIDLLDQILALVPDDAGVVVGAIRHLRRLRPVLVREFAKVPADRIVEGLHALGTRMLQVGVDDESDRARRRVAEGA